MFRGEGTIADRGYDGPTAERMALESCNSRCVLSDGSLTTLASMSSPNESKWPPVDVVRWIAASERRRSRCGLLNDGRYQATIRIPFACAAAMNLTTWTGKQRP